MTPSMAPRPHDARPTREPPTSASQLEPHDFSIMPPTRQLEPHDLCTPTRVMPTRTDTERASEPRRRAQRTTHRTTETASVGRAVGSRFNVPPKGTQGRVAMDGRASRIKRPRRGVVVFMVGTPFVYVQHDVYIDTLTYTIIHVCSWYTCRKISWL